MLVFCLIACAGCGRIGFDLLALRARDGGLDARNEGGLDASADGAPDGSTQHARDDGMLDAAEDGDVSDAATCSPCDPIAQCGCGSGQACYLPATGDPTICNSAGSLPQGALCNVDTDCAPGLSCQLFLSSMGVCEPYCRSDADCDDTCAGLVVGGASVGGCQTTCNPMTGGGCAAPLACRTAILFPQSGGQRMGVGCGDDVGAGQGAPCMRLSDCGPGFACVNYECSALCLVAAPACPSGYVCLAFPAGGAPSRLIVGGVEYGACAR